MSNSEKTKILLIDDDDSLRKVYEMQFESFPQYQLFLAPSAQEAEKIAKKEKPALILLDLIMGKKPGEPIGIMDKLNGFNLLSFFRAEPGLKEIPVVVFSNLDNPKDMERARNLGANDYWVKSLMVPSEVMDRIKDFLELENAKRAVNESMEKVQRRERENEV
mgnify:CR=1 FL=1